MDMEKRIEKIYMTSGIERKLEMFYLNQYLAYLNGKGNLSKEEIIEIKKEIDYKNYSKKISCKDMDTSILELTCLYYEILTYANNFQLFWIYPNINYNEYLSYAKEFFKSFDVNLYKLYQEMNNSNSISISNNINTIAGATYHVNNNQSYILMDEFMPFYKILTLIHEMGHAYNNYLKESTPSINELYIEGECISSAFELLFFKFLRDNHLENNEIISAGERCSYMNKLASMNNAYIFNYLMSDGHPKEYDEIKKTFFKLSPDIYKRLGLINFNKKVQNQYCRQIKNYDNNYAYGLLFALIMQNIDEKEAKNIIKTFPSYANTHERHEIIERFSDEEYLKANKDFADRVLSKTYYKKH